MYGDWFEYKTKAENGDNRYFEKQQKNREIFNFEESSICLYSLKYSKLEAVSDRINSKVY